MDRCTYPVRCGTTHSETTSGRANVRMSPSLRTLASVSLLKWGLLHSHGEYVVHTRLQQYQEDINEGSQADCVCCVFRALLPPKTLSFSDIPQSLLIISKCNGFGMLFLQKKQVPTNATLRRARVRQCGCEFTRLDLDRNSTGTRLEPCCLQPAADWNLTGTRLGSD